MQNEVLSGARPRVFIADLGEDSVAERVFVLAKGFWYERIEGQSGAVEFSPFADEEAELNERLAAAAADFELTESDEDFAAEVVREFMEQTPLYPEAPELSEQWE